MKEKQIVWKMYFSQSYSSFKILSLSIVPSNFYVNSHINVVHLLNVWKHSWKTDFIDLAKCEIYGREEEGHSEPTTDPRSYLISCPCYGIAEVNTKFVQIYSKQASMPCLYNDVNRNMMDTWSQGCDI